MQTQKDHVEAYSFMMGRMTSALVVGDASNLEVSARRAWNGLVIGAVLAALIVTGFFLYGLILHFTHPKTPGTAPPVRTAQTLSAGHPAPALLPEALWRIAPVAVA